MPALETGRVCLKLKGRSAGSKVVFIEMADENFALVEGRQKRKKCNVRHLFPTEEKLKVSKSTSREEIVKLLGTKAK
jgi:large subunit ribosomal protein L14e